MKVFKVIKKSMSIVVHLIAAFFIVFLIIDLYVYYVAKSMIISTDAATKNEKYDCIIVLGASVKNDDTPSVMLRDRLLKGIQLYNNGCAPKMIMSGDHGDIYYNEVGVMKKYAIERGVPSSDIFLDHAGFSTYETMYRAREIFGAKRVLIVTQRYHLTRAVYIANELGLEADGVCTEDAKYGGELKRSAREFFAIGKDFVMSKLKVKPSVMGNHIDLNGDGNITNDKEGDK